MILIIAREISHQYEPDGLEGIKELLLLNKILPAVIHRNFFKITEGNVFGIYKIQRHISASMDVLMRVSTGSCRVGSVHY